MGGGVLGGVVFFGGNVAITNVAKIRRLTFLSAWLQLGLPQMARCCAEKGVNGGWEWEFRVQEGGNVGGPAGFLSSVF